ncbi:hypothetical protein [Nocardioides sp.]|uniref:hypothetical protein n=1 Tax=Nocardioides sp. TaxID=35761 RepID=UPI002636B1D3|nr:hypothetical protein [Nocardioides sp.]
MSGEDRSWEHELFGVLDDLEAQAEAEFAEARRAEVADRARAEYLHVTLASRLMADLGRQATLQVEGVGTLTGTLDRVATGWLLLTSPTAHWIVRHVALLAVRDAGSRSVPEVAWPVTAKLRLPSPVRRLADDQVRCVFHHRDASRAEGVPTRVGQDFIEIDAGGRLDLIPVPALSAIQYRP